MTSTTSDTEMIFTSVSVQIPIDCLNSNCEVRTAIRQEIEATPLLPKKELPEIGNGKEIKLIDH
ncbi:hypothetical protein [Microcoleus sp. F4-D5]|uniref:hypothetical protein n=1 Tax=Microcoleus sp. F4-D5 TaxID=2818760 RepID=UPI002FD24F15